MTCYMNETLKCTMCERCLLAKLCDNGEADKTPFAKELFCQITTISELANNGYKKQNPPIEKTYGEFLSEWLWLWRNAIKRGLELVFDYGEIGKSYPIIVSLYNKVCELITDYNATFLKEAIKPLQSQIRTFDKWATGKEPPEL